jgi:hypothetical protein
MEGNARIFARLLGAKKATPRSWLNGEAIPPFKANGIELSVTVQVKHLMVKKTKQYYSRNCRPNYIAQ